MGLLSLLTMKLAWVFLSRVQALPYKSQHETKGVLLVDGITFPKLIPSLQFVTLILVVQKKQIGDYGTDSIRADYFEFANFVQLKVEVDEETTPILFTQLIVNGAENSGVAKGLGLKEDFVHPVLFALPKGVSIADAIPYPASEPFHRTSMLQFLSQHTEFYFKIPGTLKAFDKLAREFIQTADPVQRSALLDATKNELDTLSAESNTGKEDAKYYIKVMGKIFDKGDNFVQDEIVRLEAILQNTKMTASSRKNMKNHVNVLKIFRESRVRVKEDAEL
jgi:hypothetical protein